MFLESLRLHNPAPVRQSGVNNSDTYLFEKSPLTMDEYLERINYVSYFNIIGLPYSAIELFHRRAKELNLNGAINAIRPHFQYMNGGIRNLNFITSHLKNAIDRVVI